MVMPLVLAANVSAVVTAATSFFAVFGAARSCAAAAEAGTSPRTADLKRLGIPVTEFRNIGLKASH
ncbi:hypothetical protein ACFSM5_13165 [Lacibacterium aquatile]|uniref:Uncharacterized protein n=1 Tax=Lacibacterium aquatile TaxID=1168082 RepID=A0ABW5DX85_9PROT